MGVIVNCDGGHAHQICSFMWADNYGIMSHSKTHLEQIKKDLLEEAEWTCNRHPQASEMTEDITIHTRTGRHVIRFETGDNILDYSFNQGRRKTAWMSECKMQTRPGGAVRRFAEAKTCRGG